MSYTPCPLCTAPLRHREGSPCTNPLCEAHPDAGRYKIPPDADPRAVARRLVREVTRQNRRAFRGLAVGRRR